MTNSVTALPSFDTDEEFENLKVNTSLFETIARALITRHHLPDEPLSLFEGTNIVFACGDHRVIKLYPPMHQHQYESDVLIMEHLHHQLSVSTPALEFHGEIQGWPYIIMSRLEGTLLEGLWETLDHANKIIIIRELGALIREVHALPTNGLESIDSHWQTFIRQQIDQCVSRHRELKLSDALLQEIPKYLDSIEPLLYRSISR